LHKEENWRGRQTREDANDLHLGDRDELAETLEHLLDLAFGGDVAIHSILLFAARLSSSSDKAKERKRSGKESERKIRQTLISSRAFSMRTTG